MATKIEELRQAASNAWDAYCAEMAQYSEDNLPTEEQAARVDELRTAATDAQRDLQRAEEFSRSHADWQRQNEEMSRSNRRPVSGSEGQARRPGSVGAMLAESEAYRQWVSNIPASGRMPQNHHQFLMQFGGLADIDRRSDLLTGGSPTSAGALVVPDQYGPITEFGRRPLVIRDLITNLTTDSDTVEFVRVTDETSNAAIVPEATATDPEESGSTPGYKPESGMEFERVPTPVKTIAHWIPATTRALADAGQLRGLIDSFLRYGVDLELEDQIVTGDGLGENFDGIFGTSGVQQLGFMDTGQNDEAFFRTARRARRLVRDVGRRQATGYILNPIDKEEIDVARDGNQRFFGNGPFSMGPDTLWGLPVVESEAVPAGYGVVGDLRTCVLWDRQQSSISVSNSHADFFIRNLVAILCELRAAFGILKPNALVIFETNAGS